MSSLDKLHYIDFVFDAEKQDKRPMAFSILFSVVHSFNSDQTKEEWRVGVDVPGWEAGTLTKAEFQQVLRVFGTADSLAKFMQRSSIQRLTGLLTEIPVAKSVLHALKGKEEEIEFVGLCRNRAAEKRAKERLPFAQWNQVFRRENEELIETEGPGVLLVTMSSKSAVQKYPLFLGKKILKRTAEPLRFTVYGAVEAGGLPSFNHVEKVRGKNCFWAFGESVKRLEERL